MQFCYYFVIIIQPLIRLMNDKFTTNNIYTTAEIIKYFHFLEQNNEQNKRLKIEYLLI